MARIPNPGGVARAPVRWVPGRTLMVTEMSQWLGKWGSGCFALELSDQPTASFLSLSHY